MQMILRCLCLKTSSTLESQSQKKPPSPQVRPEPSRGSLFMLVNRPTVLHLKDCHTVWRFPSLKLAYRRACSFSSIVCATLSQSVPLSPDCSSWCATSPIPHQGSLWGPGQVSSDNCCGARGFFNQANLCSSASFDLSCSNGCGCCLT
jgi:hypothetical protein